MYGHSPLSLPKLACYLGLSTTACFSTIEEFRVVSIIKEQITMTKTFQYSTIKGYFLPDEDETLDSGNYHFVGIFLSRAL